VFLGVGTCVPGNEDSGGIASLHLSWQPRAFRIWDLRLFAHVAVYMGPPTRCLATPAHRGVATIVIQRVCKYVKESGDRCIATPIRQKVVLYTT
jgi:hypothetical protein